MSTNVKGTETHEVGTISNAVVFAYNIIQSGRQQVIYHFHQNSNLSTAHSSCSRPRYSTKMLSALILDIWCAMRYYNYIQFDGAAGHKA